jgi:hypothetical protein
MCQPLDAATLWAQLQAEYIRGCATSLPTWCNPLRCAAQHITSNRLCHLQLLVPHGWPPATVPHLAAIGVGSCICHTEDACSCVLELTRDLVLKLAAIHGLAPPASPSGVAALDHKVTDDAMKLHSSAACIQ